MATGTVERAGWATIDEQQMSDVIRGLYVRFPIEFHRGARDAQMRAHANVTAGVEFHGVTRSAEEAYRAGWAHYVLRRPAYRPV